MKIDRGEDTYFYLKFVYVFIWHLLHPKQFLKISQKSKDTIGKLGADWENINTSFLWAS